MGAPTQSPPLPPCDLCKRRQLVYGAVLIGPPEHIRTRMMTEKTHVCVECYDKIFTALGGS